MIKENFSYLKAFQKLNRNIDDEINNLSDKFHELELSHNRKIRLLKQIKMFLEYNSDYSKKTLLNKIDQELQFIGRINYGANT